MWRDSAIVTQGSQTPQGWMVGSLRLPSGPMQLSAAGDDARRGGLAHAPHAGKHEGMGDAAGGEGVGQRAHQRLLPDQAGEIAWAVFARQHAIGLRPRGRKAKRWFCLIHGPKL